MTVQRGQPLFTVTQAKRRVPFLAPVSGKVIDINSALGKHPEALETTPYAENWICVIDADNLDAEIPALKIGNTAVAFFQEELERFKETVKKMSRNPGGRIAPRAEDCIPANCRIWMTGIMKAFVGEFFRR